MTAEVVVASTIACALAADSAMTITSNSTVKILNGNEKIFELSKKNPVGLMHYNLNSFCGVTWELIVKTFRKAYNDQSNSSLIDYANDFISYINTASHLISNESKESQLMHIFAEYIRNTYSDLERTKFPSIDYTKPFLPQIHEFLIEHYRTENEALHANEYFSGFSDSDYPAAKIFATTNYLNIARTIIPMDGNILPGELSDLLIEFFSLILIKKNVSHVFTGLVFCGYGEDDYFPVIHSIQVHGIFNDKVMYSVQNNKSIQLSPTNNSTVFPFAHEDEVASFINGCNSNTLNFIHQKTLGLLYSLKSDLLTQNLINQHDSHIIDREINNFMNLWNINIQEYLRSNNSNKVIDMISSLSKADLANMAEFLVNLSAYKLKVSNDYEVVGGPIDVAVISKSEGFVWIKRKLYFDESLNYNFFNKLPKG